ncbi:UPF0052-domain-containing protein [Fistulina hepatica ATCC 64428]|uniref:UPF0052-domain-containing protein n=1 Tax=Fistulina hepatica ATCC 64428 TaxID=1128425 RepID=A0A0D7A5P9_9AGAR|nr:UPF0052-domain-containing protein [Fistulina hepatica ATCC 64428]
MSSGLKKDNYTPKPSFAVISGGTGGNAICSAFDGFTAYIIPVSDDGGSSSEIIRVLGGPSIGDIRSRLIRLVPPGPPHSSINAIRELLSYRLPCQSEDEARRQWREIVEGKSHLWNEVDGDRKEVIRGFLTQFDSEVLRRANKNFRFLNGSIGNYFLAAAQSFFRSLPSGIFLFTAVTDSNTQENAILPVIVTNHTPIIAAELEDGSKLVGQCEISHPVRTKAARSQSFFTALDVDEDEDAPWSPTSSTNDNVKFEHGVGKATYEELDSKIHRLFYINSYGTEVFPNPNPQVLEHLGLRNVLVYSCGSLWTSIIPCLALRGMADAIHKSKTLVAKILLLNATNDRETTGYTATDYIHVIARTLNTSYSRMHAYPGLSHADTTYPTSAFVTDMIYLTGGKVPVDAPEIERLGIRCFAVDGFMYDADLVRQGIDTVMVHRCLSS